MGARFKFFEHTADTIFEGYGKTYEAAFANAALAMQEVMTNTAKVAPKQEEKISAKGVDLKALLYDFLEKFLILKDAKNLVFSEIKVEKITEGVGECRLTAVARGERFDSKKHTDKTVVKAVTYHEMEIGEKDKKKYVRVLVDI
jgi:SHS2 domain-containing protein